MAKITLPTNYRDDILNPSADGKRKYIMSYNQDGTVSFEDVTPYEQVGSDYGAGDINTTNEAVNESFDKNKLIKDLDTINALTEEGYAPDALAFKELNDSLGGYALTTKDGKIAYYQVSEGADSATPFNSANFEGYLAAEIRSINDSSPNSYYWHYYNNVKTEKNWTTNGTHEYDFGNIKVIQNKYSLTLQFPKAVTGTITNTIQRATASRDCGIYILNNETEYTLSLSSQYPNFIHVLFN